MPKVLLTVLFTVLRPTASGQTNRPVHAGTSGLSHSHTASATCSAWSVAVPLSPSRCARARTRAGSRPRPRPRRLSNRLRDVPLIPVRVRQPPRPVQLAQCGRWQCLALGSAGAMEANLAKATAAAVGTEKAVASAPSFTVGMPSHPLGGVIPASTADHIVMRNGVLVLPGTENAGGGLPTYSMPHPKGM